jgi:hypothetical protein
MTTILITITILISIYGIGCLIAWVFIDIWNINQISNMSDELYDYQNAFQSWYVIYYLFKQSREKK